MMAVDPIPGWFQKLWKVWDVRTFVLLSLVTQAILIFLAPLRKRMPQKWVTILIWSAYLLADWVAIFALGLISENQGDDCEPPSVPSSKAKNKYLLTFWAPFLLLHLGGPDNITAFALEDNELWIRHLIGLAIQFVAVGYIFLQSLPNELWVPTSLMLFVGVIKYAERSGSLYLASLKSFRDSLVTKPDPGPNYAKLMEENAWMNESLLPAKIAKMKDPEADRQRNIPIEEEPNDNNDPDDIVMVEKAYEFFDLFKGIIVDLIFSFHQRDDSRNFFINICETEKAYRVIEIELSLIYDVLYTKASILHSLKGYVLRTTAFASIFAALILFLFIKKDEMHDIDITVTYALLIGGMSLEAVALVNLIFSDWTIALIKSSKTNSTLSKFFVSKILTKNFFFSKSRWSTSVSQLSLINFCLCKRRKWLESTVDCLRLKDILDESQYKSRIPLSPKLKEFIFKELKRKSGQAKDLDTTKKICSSRGEYVLLDQLGLSDIIGWSFKVEYDESLLLWHIATDILYHQESEDPNDSRELCKILSDYMLYLLVIQPTVVSAVASIAQIRYQDTCAEAEVFFSEMEPLEVGEADAESVPKFFDWFKLKAKANELKEACTRLLEVNTSVKPSDVKGDKSKSVLFDGVILAKDLKQLKDLKVDKWEIMSKVWVELLCYAASHCRATTHAQQVSTGGELVTLLWLLMIHFGLGEQFSIVAGHTRAKLIMQK